MGALLKVQDLCIHFETEQGDIQAVRGVSFCLGAGEALAIVGESGCGKTVLCKSIAGLLPRSGRVAGGEILFDGKRPTPALRGKELAMVFQDAASALDPSYTIGAQITEALCVQQKITRAGAKQRAVQLLGLVGIDSPAERFSQYPHQFSGGMCQRAALAIALSCSPRLLLADEPTTALDGNTQAQILDLLAEQQKKAGTAILFITHDLSVAARAAQRIAVMYAGKLVELGTAEEVLCDPRHPYTQALLAAVPAEGRHKRPLCAIEGAPPSLLHPPRGDAFAARNPSALAIDYECEPHFFAVSPTHFAATWLLDPRAAKKNEGGAAHE